MAGTVDFRPARVNVRSVRGDTVAMPISLVEGGNPASLAGRTFAAQLRVTTEDVDDTPFTTEVSGGTVTLRMTADVTEGLEGQYAWDLQQTLGGAVRTLVGGLWTFDPDVTR